MDCERVHPDRPYYPAGPKNRKESEENILAFCSLLLSQGISPSLFAVPEACEEHRELFTELSQKGCEIGLHLHPRTFGYGINEFLGLLPYEIQYDLLERAKSKFEESLGFSPKIFRAGFYSANKDTFSVLSRLGFTHTSTSVARRHNPCTGALWRYSPNQPYMVNGLSEVPVTSHPERNLPVFGYEARGFLRKLVSYRPGRKRFGRNALSHLNSIVFGFHLNIKAGPSTSLQQVRPLDFQIEHRDIWLLKSIVKANVERSLKLSMMSSTFICTTHNDVPFGDDTERYRKRLVKLLDFLRNLQDVKVRFTTLTQLPKECFIATENNNTL